MSKSSHKKHRHKKHNILGGWDSVEAFKKEMGDDTNWEGVDDNAIKDMLLIDNKQELANKQFEHEKRLKEEQSKYSQIQREKEQADLQRQREENMRKSAELDLQLEKRKSPLLHHTIYERRAPLFDLYDVNRYLRKENSRVTDQLEEEKRRERLEKEKLKEELEKERLRRSLLKLKSKKTKSKSRSRSKSRSKSKPRSRSKSRSKSR